MLAFLGRVKIFFSERYPLVTGFSSVAIGTWGMFLIWTRINGLETQWFSSSVITATASMFLVSLILRFSDEIKDRESDKIHFPERCLPAGKVRYSDVKILLAICSLMFIVLNIIWGGSFLIFGLLCLYLFLFYHYFFMGHIISKNLLLALVTHNPLLFVASLYTLSIFSQGQDITSAENFLLAYAFWMSSIGWETARKIRVPEMETEYETYSVALGSRAACLLPLLAFNTQFAAFIYLTSSYSLAFIIQLSLGCLILAYNVYFLVFMGTLRSKLSEKFQLITEAYLLISSLIIVLISLLEGR